MVLIMEYDSSLEDDELIQFPDDIDYIALWQYFRANPLAAKELVKECLKEHPKWQEQQNKIRKLREDLNEMNKLIEESECELEKIERFVNNHKSRIDNNYQDIGTDKVVINKDGIMTFEGSFQRIIDLDELRAKGKRLISTLGTEKNITLVSIPNPNLTANKAVLTKNLTTNSTAINSTRSAGIQTVSSDGNQILKSILKSDIKPKVKAIGNSTKPSATVTSATIQTVDLSSDEEESSTNCSSSKVQFKTIKSHSASPQSSSSSSSGTSSIRFHPSPKSQKSKTIVSQISKPQIGAHINPSTSTPTASTSSEIDIQFVHAKLPNQMIFDGVNQRKLFEVNEKCICASNLTNLTLPWKLAKIICLVDTTLKRYKVKFEGGDQKIFESVEPYKLAYRYNPKYRLKVGERVVAKVKLDPGDALRSPEYYSGTIAEPPKPNNLYRYLVFLDNDTYHYVKPEGIFSIYSEKHIIPENHGISENLMKFVRDFIKKYPERPMLRMPKNASIKVRNNENWELARVMDTDSSLFLIDYSTRRKTEWIYRGSYRLFDVFKQVFNAMSKPRMSRSTSRPMRNLMQRSQHSIIWCTEDDQENQIKSKPKDMFPVEKKKTTMKQTARKSIGKSSEIFAKLRQSAAEATADAKTFEVDVVRIPKIKAILRDFIEHTCSPRCLKDSNEKLNFYNHNPFFIPIMAGWKRQKFKFSNHGKSEIAYRAPCGRKLRSLDEVFKYLRITKSTLDIDYFTFSTGLKLYKTQNKLKVRYFIEDVSNGLEPQPISCVNTIDDSVIKGVTYCNVRFMHENLKFKIDQESKSCCDCEDNCANKMTCACQKLTYDMTDIAPRCRPVIPGYHYKRLYEFIVSGIFECNSNCKCNSRCPNKVVQNGIRCRLQLFKTLNKGWGVRVLHDVPKGTFICTYAAQLLDEPTADVEGKLKGDEYLADLDYIDVCENHKEGYESDVEDPDDSDYKDSDSNSDDSDYKVKKRKFQESDDEDSQGSSKRETQLRKRNEVEKPVQTSLREFLGEDFVYILDAKQKGNIGRYLNHSCDPNCFVQNVFVDTHDPRFPWVSFFAKKHIPAFTELTWDYNYQVGSVPGKKLYCYCGTSKCSKRLL